jgi:ankyrin repeat protein
MEDWSRRKKLSLNAIEAWLETGATRSMPSGSNSQTSSPRSNRSRTSAQSVTTPLGRLLAAASQGDVAGMRAAVALGVDLSSANEDGWSAIHLVAEHGHDVAIDWLLTHGANPNCLGKDRWTPLMWCAAARARKGGRRACLVHAASARPARARPRLTTAVAARSPASARLAVRAPPCRLSGRPPRRAARRGHMMAVKMLIEAGSQCNATHVKGWSALHLSAACGHAEIISVLNAHGARINAQTNNGSTALHLGASQGHFKACEILLVLDTSLQLVHVEDKRKATALHLAAAARAEPVVELLLKYGAAREAQDDQGRTPLEILMEKKAATPRLLRLLSSSEAIDELRNAVLGGAGSARAAAAARKPPATPAPAVTPAQVRTTASGRSSPIVEESRTPDAPTQPRAPDAPSTAEPVRLSIGGLERLSAELGELRELVAELADTANASAAGAEEADAKAEGLRLELGRLTATVPQAVDALRDAVEAGGVKATRADAKADALTRAHAETQHELGARRGACAALRAGLRARPLRSQSGGARASQGAPQNRRAMRPRPRRLAASLRLRLAPPPPFPAAQPRSSGRSTGSRRAARRRARATPPRPAPRPSARSPRPSTPPRRARSRPQRRPSRARTACACRRSGWTRRSNW